MLSICELPAPQVIEYMHHGVDLGLRAHCRVKTTCQSVACLRCGFLNLGCPARHCALRVQSFPGRHYRACTADDNDAEACIFEAASFIDYDTFSHTFFSHLFQAWRQQPVLLATGPEFHARVLGGEPALAWITRCFQTFVGDRLWILSSSASLHVPDHTLEGAAISVPPCFPLCQDFDMFVIFPAPRVSPSLEVASTMAPCFTEALMPRLVFHFFYSLSDFFRVFPLAHTRTRAD